MFLGFSMRIFYEDVRHPGRASIKYTISMRKKKLSTKKTILFTQKVKKYQGSYIAVAKDRIVASGKSAKEVSEMAKKILGPTQKIEAIYYIPTKKDLLTALCVFPIIK